jgi:LysM repeat protein
MKPRQCVCALTVAALLVFACVSVAGATPASTPPQSASPGGYTFYTVQPGDNLFRISLRFGVSVYALMQANGLTNPNYIYVGQVLRIPTGPITPPPPQPPPPPPPQPPPPSGGFYYTVVSGDSLAIIAARFGTTVYAIMQANGLVNPNFIYRGQVLWIPGTYKPPQPVYGRWRGEYFGNERLAGAPSVIRYDPYIAFDWGTGSPHARIDADCFSVRWTRNIWLSAGTWRFTAATDDGVRLYVDNALVIDQWHEQPATPHTAEVQLGTGNHAIRMEYYELTGLASAHLDWQLVSGGSSCSRCGSTQPAGSWQGEYFDNMYLDGGPDLVRSDPAIDFDWERKSPGESISVDIFSARWTRTVYLSAGTYRFHATVDDGVRLFVDGRVVIDEWDDNPGTEFIGDLKLPAGNHALKVEYYEKGYEAKIKVWWEKLR